MKKTPTRRSLALTLFAVALVFGTFAARAQERPYPGRPVKVVVPFVPGGNADSTARIFAESFGRQLGQPFVVENRGGAGGLLGAAQVARAEPDGGTLLLSSSGPIVSAWQLAGKSAPYTMKDLKAVALLTIVPDVIVVNAASAFQTFEDFVSYAQSHSGEAKFGHPGNGTAGHVNILQLQKALRSTFIVASYKGASPAVQDLMGGQLDAVATDLPSALQLVRSGKLRALAVVFPKRVPSLAMVPTMAELKRPEVDVAPFTALMAPRDLPESVVAQLRRASAAAVADAGVRKRVEDIGGIPVALGPEAFERMLAKEEAVFAALVDSGLLKAE